MKYVSPYRRYTYLACFLFIFFYPLALFLLPGLPYPLWIATWSLITLLLFGYDKLQSQSGSPRIPEKVLHALILAGGFLGALIGMSVFKHKKRKTSFWIITWLSVFLHGFILWKLYPDLFTFFSGLNRLS